MLLLVKQARVSEVPLDLHFSLLVEANDYERDVLLILPLQVRDLVLLEFVSAYAIPIELLVSHLNNFLLKVNNRVGQDSLVIDRLPVLGCFTQAAIDIKVLVACRVAGFDAR